MEKERLAREKEEQDKAERAKKIKEEFSDTNVQWEKDKKDMRNMAKSKKGESMDRPINPPGAERAAQ